MNTDPQPLKCLEGENREYCSFLFILFHTEFTHLPRVRGSFWLDNTLFNLPSFQSKIRVPQASQQHGGHSRAGRDQSKYSKSASPGKSSDFFKGEDTVLAWVAREPDPSPDTQVDPGCRELACWATELSGLPVWAKPPHQKMRLSACSKPRKLLGSLVSKSLIPSLGYISTPSPAHGARRLEAGRNPKHSSRNRFQLAQEPCF